MTLNRGDVGLVRFPHTAGARGKKRPVVVVQAALLRQLDGCLKAALGLP
jgi:mRNA-degrading endonuclease toxin of MazEF toxin-antitoxin module